ECAVNAASRACSTSLRERCHVANHSAAMSTMAIAAAPMTRRLCPKRGATVGCRSMTFLQAAPERGDGRPDVRRLALAGRAAFDDAVQLALETAGARAEAVVAEHR